MMVQTDREQKVMTYLRCVGESYYTWIITFMIGASVRTPGYLYYIEFSVGKL